jgi:AmmeMemoRadiSam system protein B
MTSLYASLRSPAAAGTFYPRSSKTLRQTVDGLLAHIKVEERVSLCGIIAPHAGYAYSGLVAAHAFACLRPLHGRIERALIIGPAHFVSFLGISAPSDTAFTTPLGNVLVDVATVEALHEEGLVAIDDEPHVPEHAIEVELPFLQSIFPNVAIVPLLCGSTTAEAVAAVIARIWSDDTLLIVSSDLSHFESYRAARVHDERTAEAIEALDAAAIGPQDACGHLAIRGALREVARRGLAVTRLVLSNSGDTAGDRRSVVGYGAWAFHAQR